MNIEELIASVTCKEITSMAEQVKMLESEVVNSSIMIMIAFD
jgi:hypothetical protein